LNVPSEYVICIGYGGSVGCGIDAKIKIMAFNIGYVKIIVDDENIMSVSREVVIKVSKEEFLKRTIKMIKELLERSKIGLIGFLS
jgi:hypothetical protein